MRNTEWVTHPTEHDWHRGQVTDLIDGRQVSMVMEGRQGREPDTSGVADAT